MDLKSKVDDKPTETYTSITAQKIKDQSVALKEVSNTVEDIEKVLSEARKIVGISPVSIDDIKEFYINRIINVALLNSCIVKRNETLQL